MATRSEEAAQEYVEVGCQATHHRYLLGRCANNGRHHLRSDAVNLAPIWYG